MPSFNNNVPRNLNRLILTSKASRSTTRNCLLCLNIYQSITGQKSNLQKFAIFLPSWCNSKVAKAISRVLGIKMGSLMWSFPFFYLGAPISPKKPLIRHLQFLTDHVKVVVSSWNHSPITTVGCVVLINSTIFAIPNYLLSVMNLPNSILDSILRLLEVFSEVGITIIVVFTQWVG